jgi:hypothetical protein
MYQEKSGNFVVCNCKLKSLRIVTWQLADPARRPAVFPADLRLQDAPLGADVSVIRTLAVAGLFFVNAKFLTYAIPLRHAADICRITDDSEIGWEQSTYLTHTYQEQIF